MEKLRYMSIHMILEHGKQLWHTPYVIMVEKRIRVALSLSIYWHAKVNNKCMEDYDKKLGIIVSTILGYK